MTREIGVALALVAAGCSIDPPNGIYRCSADSDCPEGLGCSSGFCYRPGTAPPDAGRDAAPPEDAAADAGADADADLGDGGCVDGDGDGVCPPEDCDDGVFEVKPGATEACVDDVFRDDDCDGHVDETCSLFVGTVHVPVRAYPETADNPRPNRAGRNEYSPWLSVDGLRLYFAGIRDGSRGTPLYMAERASPDQPFERAIVVAGTDAQELAVVSLSDDELALVAQPVSGDGSLVMARRDARGDPFGPFTAATTTPTPGTGHFHPTLSADGLELYYVETRTAGTDQLVRATRSSTMIAFGARSVVYDDANVRYPRLSDDGLTLYVATPGISTLTRDDPEQPFTGTPEPLSAFADAGYPNALAPTFRNATREVYFHVEATSEGPAFTSFFRARVCREGPCATVEIPCDSPDVRGTDGLSCYHVTEMSRTVGAARDLCTAWGGDLAALHSPDEVATAQTVLEVVSYLGAQRASEPEPFVYLNGEPFSFAPWSAGEPGTMPSDRCTMIQLDGTFIATDCTTTRRALCGRRQWPTW